MKRPEQVLRDLVRQWTAKAEIDFRTAGRLIQDPEPIRESIAFHCQQTVEKYVKAFLVRHQVEFPKTNNLDQLLELLGTVNQDLAAKLEETEVLTPFGVEIRYPGDFPELLPGQERTLFEITIRARHELMERLAPFLSEI